jgi:hypothetical protein
LKDGTVQIFGDKLEQIKKKNQKNEMGRACGIYAKQKCIQDFGGDT